MERETVIMLHGILRSPRQMRALERRLTEEGYAVRNLGYASRGKDIGQLVDGLHASIHAHIASAQQAHFVGYSMGALLTRAYLHRYRPGNLGRVVHLAPPNTDSEIANALKDMAIYRWLYGPAGQQLTTDQQAIAHLFGPVDYPLGILAGTRCIDPWRARILGGVSDGTVALERTKLPGMLAHKSIHATHTFFAAHPETIENTAHFLRHGRFAG